MTFCFLPTYTAPSDYTETSTVLTFDADTLRDCTEIPIVDDDNPETPPLEEFAITITSGDPPVSLMTPTAIVTIMDDDGKITMNLCTENFLFQCPVHRGLFSTYTYGMHKLL